MKVLIIEDEAPAARRLINLLKESGQVIEILGIVESVEQGIKWFSENPQPDLIFSDIQLSDDLSFTIFKELKLNIPVIFTTAFDEYAIKAFEYQSVDYLLKPVKAELLKRSLEKYKNFHLQKSSPAIDISALIDQMRTKTYRTRFLVFYKESLIPVDVSEIAFFLSEEGATFLYTLKNIRYIVEESLEQLEKELNPSQFFRANRQFLLSAKSIKKIHSFFNQKLKVEIVNNSDLEVIISKLKATEFKNWLNK